MNDVIEGYGNVCLGLGGVVERWPVAIQFGSFIRWLLLVATEPLLLTDLWEVGTR